MIIPLQRARVIHIFIVPGDKPFKIFRLRYSLGDQVPRNICRIAFYRCIFSCWEGSNPVSYRKHALVGSTLCFGGESPSVL